MTELAHVAAGQALPYARVPDFFNIRRSAFRTARPLRLALTLTTTPGKVPIPFHDEHYQETGTL